MKRKSLVRLGAGLLTVGLICGLAGCRREVSGPPPGTSLSYVDEETMSRETALEKVEELDAFDMDRIEDISGVWHPYESCLDPDWCIRFKAPQTDPPIEVWGYRETDLEQFPPNMGCGVPAVEELDYFCHIFQEVSYPWGEMPAESYCVFTKPDARGMTEVYCIFIQ